MPAEEPLDLRAPRHIHVVGIGGAGMSAIALVLRAMGHTVSGSDLKDSPVAQRLGSQGISVALGHRAANAAGADIVTYSPAVAPDNVELGAAAEAGAHVAPRS
jgi:UDP-N-acetylmuramate--alanine ligase